MMHRSSRLPRRPARIITAAALLGALAGVGLTAGPAAASSPPRNVEARTTASTPGACTTAEGVTVIIDFQELGGGSYVRCASGSPRTGFEALEMAGISYDTTARSPGFLCRISGKPANDPCRVPSPADAYWSYWLAPRGGAWCFSNYGAGIRPPPPGTVEGWSFALDKSASATPPPAIAPPAPLPGVPAPQLPGRDCTVPTVGATTTTTQPPSGPAPTRPPTVPGPGPGQPPNPTGPSAPGSPSGPGHPGGNDSSNGSAPSSDGTSAPSDGGRDGSTSTTDPSKTSATPSSGDGPSDGDGKADGAPTGSAKGSDDRGVTDAEEIAALEGDVDLGDDGRTKGSPVPLVAAGVVAMGLVGGGVWQRRRRHVTSDPA